MKEEIGNIITVCRLYRGFTQQYMAFKLGITVGSYANLERGRVDISIKKLCLVAKILLFKPYQILILAETIHENEEYDWLPSVIRTMTVLALKERIAP